MKNFTNIEDAVEFMDSQIRNPGEGLPEGLFLLISRLTPMINVDLLIKNKQNKTLLTWRDDGYGPAGWHIPGGIIRYKETIAERITAVAKTELGVRVEFNISPDAINQIILERRNRGHFISLLYRCRLITELNEQLRCKNTAKPNPDEWLWHDVCPSNLIAVHKNIYEKFI